MRCAHGNIWEVETWWHSSWGPLHGVDADVAVLVESLGLGEGDNVVNTRDGGFNCSLSDFLVERII